ncbi:hypothetical protein IW262DRAFT_1452722 [Armillaria fumosa]|nr:hypothetical protein IW262DRAFT_1452722 [Armillaria fumosa]
MSDLPASFRYKFNSLDGEKTELTGALDNLFGESMMWPTTSELLVTGLCHILPEWIFSPLSWLPNREAARLGHFKDITTKVSRPIFEQQLVEVANDANPAEKDVVNVLAMSYLVDGAKKMTDIEIHLKRPALFTILCNCTTAIVNKSMVAARVPVYKICEMSRSRGLSHPPPAMTCPALSPSTLTTPVLSHGQRPFPFLNQAL